MESAGREKVDVLRLEYFSDIPRTSGRTPDVQLRVIDATLCIIGHLEDQPQGPQGAGEAGNEQREWDNVQVIQFLLMGVGNCI